MSLGCGDECHRAEHKGSEDALQLDVLLTSLRLDLVTNHQTIQ
jgi:hypothetical protein